MQRKFKAIAFVFANACCHFMPRKQRLNQNYIQFT